MPLYGGVFIFVYGGSDLLYNIPVTFEGSVAENRSVDTKVVDSFNNPLVSSVEGDIDGLPDCVCGRVADLV